MKNKRIFYLTLSAFKTYKNFSRHHFHPHMFNPKDDCTVKVSQIAINKWVIKKSCMISTTLIAHPGDNFHIGGLFMLLEGEHLELL